MTTDYPFVIRHAVDSSFIAYVESLIETHIHQFKRNQFDPARRKAWIMRDGVDPALKEKKLELVEKFNIRNWVMDPKFYDLIGHISEGGAVHPHTDSELPGRMHVRMNVLVMKPEGGCVPLLDGIPIDIDLGDAWLCFSSHCEHATTPVEGPKPRSIISYGLQVERAEAFALFAKYLAWKNAHCAPAAVRG